MKTLLICAVMAILFVAGCGGSDTSNEYIIGVSDVQDGSVIIQTDVTSSGSVTKSSWKYNASTGELEPVI